MFSEHVRPRENSQWKLMCDSFQRVNEKSPEVGFKVACRFVGSMGKLNGLKQRPLWMCRVMSVDVCPGVCMGGKIKYVRYLRTVTGRNTLLLIKWMIAWSWCCSLGSSDVFYRFHRFFKSVRCTRCSTFITILLLVFDCLGYCMTRSHFRSWATINLASIEIIKHTLENLIEKGDSCM